MRRILPLLMLAALPAWAQNKDAQPLPAVPPPPPGMEAFDAALEPQVTIVRNETETREEYRSNGRLYMVKVTPVAGPVYYLVDQAGDGNFVQIHGGDKLTSPPMWTIKSW
ncbi:MAG: DUF2782 domain-containing protein [Betaproteobacteria bacterium]|nr:DUF2782 domain-containing protein [Betaproteobacteria bacterium]